MACCSALGLYHELTVGFDSLFGLGVTCIDLSAVLGIGLIAGLHFEEDVCSSSIASSDVASFDEISICCLCA